MMQRTRSVRARAGLIPVSVGDRIRAVFDHCFNPEDRERIGRVVKVVRRYGHHGGFERTSPLLYVEIDGREELDHFDQSFVVEVLERYQGPERPFENVFRDMDGGHPGFWGPLRRGVWGGDLVCLASHILTNHHARITHPLDDRKLEKLFSKDHPGLVRYSGFGTVVVKAEPFRRWVKQNYPKFLATTTELDHEETQHNKEMDSLMEDDLDFFESEEHEPEEGSCYDDCEY